MMTSHKGRIEAAMRRYAAAHLSMPKQPLQLAPETEADLVDLRWKIVEQQSSDLFDQVVLEAIEIVLTVLGRKGRVL